MAKNITFENGAAVDPGTMHISFSAIVDGKPVQCLITAEALRDHFGARSPEEHLNAFEFNRPLIEAKAAELIRQGRFEKNGGIMIYSSDLP